MKKVFVALAIGLASLTAFAEATFDQIEGLIQQKNYSAAAAGLEVIIQNHPKSSKAFYAMAQAQAGLGNLEKAKKALDIATGLNPTLDFAPSSSVASLKQAITPQTAKIEVIEETHFWRNTLMALVLVGVIGGIFVMYLRKEAAEEAKAQAERDAESARIRAERDAIRKQEHMEMLARQDAERKAALAAEEALKSHKNYGKPGFNPANPDKLKTKAELKAEADAAAQEIADREARMERLRQQEANARYNAVATPAPTVTHVHNTTNSSNDMLTGVLIGNMLSGNHHSHDTTIVRETVREVPAPSRSTWEDTPAPSKSSSWDDTPSTPSRSSSWDDSSSKSSSSWSSSSSSDSSSSWSDSSSSSSSSWD